MTKDWIKKAIKHPGRCTPGSPNYDCPKGSPQWNLAQRFKYGDLHKKEHGGMAASDNVDMGYYSNPLKYFAENGINLDESFSNRYVLSIQEFKNVVPDYQYEGYINSGNEGKYKNIDKTKYPVLVDKLQDGTITYRPYTIENAEKSDTTFNEVQKFHRGGTPFIENIVPQSENYLEGLTNSNKYLDYDASNAKVGLENMKARIAGSSNPVDKILGGVNMAGDIATGAITAFAKPDSKASAYAEGSQMAQSVVKPLEKIPIVGQASKLISGIIGGALNARKQAIEDEEMNKYNKVQEYTSRNTQTAQQPSYYGQYMSKYGSNIKNLEQRLVDDIFSDYDKFMKLT